MQQSQTIKPQKLNLDIHPKYLPVDSAFYILNNEVAVNPNGGTNNGASLGKSTPVAANYPACEIEQPAGENYSVQAFSSKLTKEEYTWVYNSNGSHYISRINGNGECEIVYHGDCLKLSAAPENAITQFRARMRYEKICKNWNGKELIWTNGIGYPNCIDTEASIATNFFTTPFFDVCPDPCACISLCVPEICGCIHAEFIPLQQLEKSLSNYITDKGLMFAVQHIYYDGRTSLFSDWSTLYYQEKRCFDDGIGLSRCMKLRLPVGNPMVDRIRIAYSEDGGKSWYEYEIVEKYKQYNNSQEKWYDRQLSEQVQSTFSNVDCSFDYIFCNDKSRKSIDQKEFTRVRNPMPRNAQGIFEVGNSFGFYNYEDGVCLLPKIESEKLNVTADCNDISCVTEYVNVTVRAIVSSTGRFGNDLGFIFRSGADTFDEKDNPLDPAFFGGYRSTSNVGINQKFFDRTRNFIVYIEGTEYWAEMKQWKVQSGFINPILTGVLNYGTDEQKAIVDNFLNSGGIYYQEAVLRVPKGQKGFLRMVSHFASDGIGDSQNTSEGIIGILNNITTFNPVFNTVNQAIHNGSEIFFDTCEGDFKTNEAFVIRDNSGKPSDAVLQAQLPFGFNYTFGYIKDALGFPVEGVTIGNDFADYGTVRDVTSDHNGFYSFKTIYSIFNVNVAGELACNQWGTIQSTNISAIPSGVQHDIIINDTIVPYSTTRYAIVKQLLQDCNGNVLPNTKIVISGSKSAITDNNGIATFKVRNYKDKPRHIKAMVANNGSCIIADCDGNCNPCMAEREADLPTCFNPIPTVNLVLIKINNLLVQSKAGLKPGGSYPLAYVVQGNCGRLSAAYALPLLNIPHTQETLKYQFCKFNFDATGMVFPDWADCFKLLRGENINPFELQWRVDKVERTVGGDIKLTIQSLNDYNERYFFKTNTVYKWLEGDRIEFISNNNQILDAAQYGILNYLTISPFHDTLISGKVDAPADYFNQLLIKDDGKLSIIKEGAIIEIQRPKPSTEDSIAYREICVSIPIIQVDNGDGTTHGKLSIETGTFTTFDTYLLRRSIAGTIDNFFHHSPSDFWGDHLNDLGKVHFVDKYENERRYGRNLSITTVNKVNYFGDSIKVFDLQSQGDIIALFNNNNSIVGVCQNGNFVAKAANDLLRIGNDGIVHALPSDSIVSDPQSIPVGEYGCQYEHVGGIISVDGFIIWQDVNKSSIVRHDYNVARDISAGVVKTYCQKRFQQIEFINRNVSDNLDKLRFSVGENSQTKNVYITIKSLRDSGINNEKYPFLKTNDTIYFNPATGLFLGYLSFTPEAYGNLDLFDGDGAAFITYLNGTPYIHPVISEKWNEFYSIPCDWIFGICANEFPNKEKVFIAMELQSETRFFSPEIETDDASYISEITPIKPKMDGRKWNAGFMGNKNSRDGLFGSKLPKGYYLKMLLIRDNTDGLKYQTIDNSKRVKYSELDQVIIKFDAVEQSGFTENT